MKNNEQNTPATVPTSTQDMMLQAKSLLKEARHNFKVARKHIDIYNQYVPTEFPGADEDDPRPSERWNLDNLLEGLPEMEKKLLATFRCYFTDSVWLAPVRKDKAVNGSDRECKLASIRIAREQMREMYDRVWEYYDLVHKLRARRAASYEMEKNAAKLERIAEFYWRKTYQQDYFYAQH